MTDQPQPSIGTVAEEAARLISAVAAMAQSTAAATATATTADDPSPYAGGPAQDSAPPEAEPDPGASHVCSACGGVNNDTPVACKLCPLCQGIALLRSVRPETVDRLADFASAVATTLRDMATQSRSSGRGSGSGSGPGMPADGPTVQDIRVDDGDEG